jgi:hypothetical protein
MGGFPVVAAPPAQGAPTPPQTGFLAKGASHYQDGTVAEYPLHVETAPKDSPMQDYLAELKHDLHDEKFALAYLSACAMDSMEAMRIGLRDVLAAQGAPHATGE